MITSLSKGNLLDVLQDGFNNEQQLVAYVSWVNAQLKKKPGLKPVSDLRQDLRDGVVLAHLIEIVAGELLEGIHYSPKDNQEKRENVDKVLQFVSSKRIRMPQTSAREIVEGNLKSAMRLILALAAHFKPSASANHRAGAALGRNSTSSSANHRPHSTMAMAQNAAAALAAARSDASRSGRSVHQLRQDWQRRSSSADEEIESPCWSVRALVQQYEGQGEADMDNTETGEQSLSTSSPNHMPKDPTSSSQDKEQLFSIQSGQAKDNMTGGPAASQEHDGRCNYAWEEQLWEQQEQLEREMVEARRMVSSLQALLLRGSLPDDEQEVSLTFGEGVENVEQQLVIIRSRLDQSMEESLELKRELLKYKQEARNLQGVKDALQQRMTVQESSVLQLKQELLRTTMNRDELARQNAELHKKLEERNRLLSEYKKELGQKDRLLHQQQFKLDEAIRKLTDSNSQQADLQRELENKQRILQELTDHDDELPGSPSNGYTHPAAPELSTARAHKGTEELQLVRDALRSLRNCFGGHDPQHHTLDTLEQGMTSLMDRLYTLESQTRQQSKARVRSPGHKATHTDRDSLPSSSKLVHSHSSPMLNSSPSTKVLYFTDRSLTPFMINIPKRLGEITLQDFKVAIDREGSYRYHFKALDPEFGTVKEEMFQDEAVVPGWEGKIVAWVEEDHGEGRI
ncbi:dixin-A isoform X1 [Tachysurus fulvidraco]|uniref:dixin-A isoform X1 n=2 Tax=Tachysurus fulvidraco TaxID=1234273 RepID=UPI000F4DB05D|nr:dixin-A isoform X1 [Tachysurus fulvidraco]